MALGWLTACNREREVPLDPVLVKARQVYLDQRVNDQRLWQSEMRAQAYEGALVSLVDTLRQTRERLPLLKKLPFDELRFQLPGEPSPLPWGLERVVFDGRLARWDMEAFHGWLDDLIEAKHTLDYFTLRLTAFEPGSLENDGLDEAVVELICHAKAPRNENAEGGLDYHMLTGQLRFTWEQAAIGGSDIGKIQSIAVEDLEWRRATGTPGFVQKRRYAVGDPEQRQAVRIAPIIVKDLNGDTLPEIILGGVNLILRNQGSFEFEDHPMLSQERSLHRVMAVADLTGDGHADLLGYLQDGAAILVEGAPDGTFSDRLRNPWDEPSAYPSALALADIDGDGDLDVWAAQHRPTYYQGALPSTITDANDGFPSRLYQNDGTGTFTDITARANLGATRSRRSTGATFLDFDRDGDQDLLVISDYAGLELHLNNGTGTFENVSEPTFGNWHLLGLCAAVGRFDDDDLPDIFAGGRWSVAMQRLNAMQLDRGDFPDFRPVATQMASGNQLFLSGRQYETGPFNAEAKQTGWVNSAATADFDNNDVDDLYLATGHLTGQSIADFDSQFWRHDVYLPESLEPEVLRSYMASPALSPKLTSLRTGKSSWYGYEANRLLVNDADLGFVEMGYLQGVGLLQDSPATVAADMNQDGRMDLLVVAQRTFPIDERLAIEQSLIVYENAHSSEGHWLGVHLTPNPAAFNEVGASVTLVGAFGTRQRFLTTGPGAMVQAPASAHFGLGSAEEIDHIEILWGSGQRQVIVKPEIDRYVRITPRLDFTPVPDPPEPEPEEHTEESETNAE